MTVRTPPLAHVPRGHASYDLEISDEFRDFLNENGAALVNGRVGVVIMDYIEGADLATLLYREALRRTYDEGDPYAPEELEHLSFNELHRITANKLNFSTPGGRSRDENERGFEDEKVKAENAEKLFTTLEESGFVLPSAVLDQIRNTIDAFHRNNLYHNDLHERQIILKDGDLETPRAFIIDYGTASEKRPDPEPGRKIMDDEAVVRRLSRLTKTSEQRAREQTDAMLLEWNDRIDMLSKQPRLEGEYYSLRKAVEAGDYEVLESRLAYTSSNDTDLNNLLAMFIKIAKENPDWRDKIMDFLSTHEHDTKKRPFFHLQLRRAKEAIGR